MPELTWRPPTRDDDARWEGLLAAIEAVDQRGETYLVEDLADEWASVWAHPESDATFGWDGPDLVAFGWIKRQEGNLDGHKLDLWGGVRPDRRGEGIGRDLLRRQLDRAAEIAPTFDPNMSTVARVEVGDEQGDLGRLAARFGFEEVRRFLEMARPVSGAGVSPLPPGLVLHPWDPAAFDEATRAAHADSFADHWGSAPRSVEEWRQWYTGHRSFRGDLSFVITDDTGEVIAFALCAAYPQDWDTQPREVWINSVGTRRPWRGRGVARAALTAVLDAAAAADDGFERAILGVDSENPTGAVALYTSLGFTQVRFVATLTLPL